MLGRVGPPLWGVCVTMMVAALPLFVTRYYPFHDLAYLIELGLLTALGLSTIFFSALVALIGPQGHGPRTSCDVRKYQFFVLRILRTYVYKRIVLPACSFVCVPVFMALQYLWNGIICYYSPRRRARRRRETQRRRMDGSSMSTFATSSRGETISARTTEDSDGTSEASVLDK